MSEKIMHNPEFCPCKSTSCIRNKNCEACQAYHHANGGKTTCER